MCDRGILFVVSGPSGVGKGTLCSLLLKQIDNIFLSISLTSRPKRGKEKDGVDYYFTSAEDFEEKIRKNEFLEWAKVYNNYYGTPKKIVEEKLDQGHDVLLEIDVQGAMKVKQNMPDGVFIFIMPPALEELEKRILKRGTESEESLRLRMRKAQEELKASSFYEYVIVNDDLEIAAQKLQSIVLAERCKVKRNQKLLQTFNGR